MPLLGLDIMQSFAYKRNRICHLGRVMNLRVYKNFMLNSLQQTKYLFPRQSIFERRCTMTIMNVESLDRFRRDFIELLHEIIFCNRIQLWYIKDNTSILARPFSKDKSLSQNSQICFPSEMNWPVRFSTTTNGILLKVSLNWTRIAVIALTKSSYVFFLPPGWISTPASGIVKRLAISISIPIKSFVHSPSYQHKGGFPAPSRRCRDGSVCNMYLIYCHWIPGEGRDGLEEALGGEKFVPNRVRNPHIFAYMKKRPQ